MPHLVGSELEEGQGQHRQVQYLVHQLDERVD